MFRNRSPTTSPQRQQFHPTPIVETLPRETRVRLYRVKKILFSVLAFLKFLLLTCFGTTGENAHNPQGQLQQQTFFENVGSNDTNVSNRYEGADRWWFEETPEGEETDEETCDGWQEDCRQNKVDAETQTEVSTV
jgi:hypothetical protein